MKKYNTEIFFASITLLTVLLDQLTKYLVEMFRPTWDLRYTLIHYVQNTGAGFGILKEYTSVLAIISVIVAVAVILMYKKIPKEKLPQVFFAMFLGGVIGNLIDRLARGFVVDFIDLKVWPAFNIADAMITVAVFGLIVYFWKSEKK